MNIPETAVQAAAETFAYATETDWHQVSAPDQEIYLLEARAAIEAALPHIESALRTQIAAEIRTEGEWVAHMYYAEGRHDAARIAEEGTTK